MARSNGNGNVVSPVETEDFKLTFMAGGQVFETMWSQIPDSNKVAFVRKGIKHKLSNETYSAVQNLPEIKAGAGLVEGLSKDERKAAMEAYRANNLDAYNVAFVAEATKLWNNVLTDGEITESDRPRGDSFETELLRQQDRQIAAEFKGKKDRVTGKAMKVPTNDTDVITFADGETWTRQELRDNIMERMGDDLRAKATAAIESRKAKASETNTAEVVESAASMGFVKKSAA